MMGEGAWEPSAELLAMMHNVNRGQHDPPLRGEQCNPYGPLARSRPRSVSVRSLRGLFGRKRRKPKRRKAKR